ncbi:MULTISPECIES: hypothetical protein [unclassified Variovorax]|uniref:hypothetical protein n=1 Tax=unclassified Variovorax TaxID=663243 RepID=UPI00116082F3|nr:MULTISPECIES: hypothetical protein [unclassified Variovorax]
MATRAFVAARFQPTVDGGFVCPDFLGAWSKLTTCLLRRSVNHTVDPLRAFGVGFLMAAMQRLRPVMSACWVHGLGHAAVIHAPVSSRPRGLFQVLPTLPASRYVRDACTSADLGQFGVNLLAA